MPAEVEEGIQRADQFEAVDGEGALGAVGGIDREQGAVVVEDQHAHREVGREPYLHPQGGQLVQVVVHVADLGHMSRVQRAQADAAVDDLLVTQQHVVHQLDRRDAAGMHGALGVADHADRVVEERVDLSGGAQALDLDRFPLVRPDPQEIGHDRPHCVLGTGELLVLLSHLAVLRGEQAQQCGLRVHRRVAARDGG